MLATWTVSQKATRPLILGICFRTFPSPGWPPLGKDGRRRACRCDFRPGAVGIGTIGINDVHGCLCSGSFRGHRIPAAAGGGPTADIGESSHSITASAVAIREGDTLIPSALAVCRLMTNSNLVDCTTGRSAGFAPLRILPA